jgi:hypothetical protein
MCWNQTHNFSGDRQWLQGGGFYCWGKTEYKEKTTDLLQATDFNIQWNLSKPNLE